MPNYAAWNSALQGAQQGVGQGVNLYSALMDIQAKKKAAETPKLRLMDLDPRFKNEPVGFLPADSREAQLAVQIGKQAELTGEETKALTSAKGMGGQFANLARAYTKSKGGQQPMRAWGERKLSGILPEPVSQAMAPEEAEYASEQRLTAERLLREATGAAAPPPEQVQYQVKLLPTRYDTPQVAKGKLVRFFSDLRDKGNLAVNRLMAEGQVAKAQRVRNYLNSSLDRDYKDMIDAFSLAEPTPVPLPGDGQKKRYQILGVEGQ